MQSSFLTCALFKYNDLQLNKNKTLYVLKINMCFVKIYSQQRPSVLEYVFKPYF